jgi:hypothetical protein
MSAIKNAGAQKMPMAFLFVPSDIRTGFGRLYQAIIGS